jgi:hypothetical protein
MKKFDKKSQRKSAQKRKISANPEITLHHKGWKPHTATLMKRVKIDRAITKLPRKTSIAKIASAPKQHTRTALHSF